MLFKAIGFIHPNKFIYLITFVITEVIRCRILETTGTGTKVVETTSKIVKKMTP